MELPRCPWCGEPFDASVDEGGSQHQQYVEDCAVCCHPCVVTVEIVAGEATITVERE